MPPAQKIVAKMNVLNQNQVVLRGDGHTLPGVAPPQALRLLNPEKTVTVPPGSYRDTQGWQRMGSDKAAILTGNESDWQIAGAREGSASWKWERSKKVCGKLDTPSIRPATWTFRDDSSFADLPSLFWSRNPGVSLPCSGRRIGCH
jgi:hypothetical protein